MTPSHTRSVDVVIIGGGIAGLLAAREVEAAGLTAVVLEASERVGGRVRARNYKGTDKELEFGGNAFSREFQPHITSEYERYGLKEVGTPETGTFLQLLGGEVVEGAVPVPETEFDALERGLNHWINGVRRIQFVAGFDAQDLQDLDVSIEEYFRPLDLPKATSDFLFSWAVHCNGEDPDRVSALHMMRWFSAFDHSVWNYYAKAERKWPTSAEYLARLQADIKGEILLGDPAAAIDTTSDGVVVTTPSGAVVSGKAAVVAVPLNAWKTLTFTPPLEGGKAEAAAEGQIGANSKIFIQVRNAPSGFFGSAYQAGLGVVYKNNDLPDGTQLLVAFANIRRLDTSDLQAVQDALRSIMPTVEVLSVDEEDWNENDYRGGGLTAFRPGQLSRFDSQLRTPHGDRVFFATSDISQRWCGWLEGAAETALEAARAASARAR